MSQEMERAARKVFIWSDEKVMVEAVTNKHKETVYAKSSKHSSVNARSHLKHQKLASVRVRTAVANGRD